LYDDSYEGSS